MPLDPALKALRFQRRFVASKWAIADYSNQDNHSISSRIGFVHAFLSCGNDAGCVVLSRICNC